MCAEHSPTEHRTVADALVQFLARAGVTHLFGVAGSTIMPLLDAVEDDGRIRYVAARYELSAAEMAAGYARASARLGVVATHVGPGATSCITAMAGAHRDGVPLLLITGNEESDTLARMPYHDWQLLPVMSQLCAFSYRVTRPDELPHVLRRALGEALRGGTGTVHIDLPEDIALMPVTDDDLASWSAAIDPVLAQIADAPQAPLSRPAPNSGEVHRAVDLLARAHAPVVLLGETSRRGAAAERILDQCDGLGIPYATTFGARGGIGSRPGYAGTIGRFGSRDTTALVGDADVVLALGAELTDVDTVRWSIPRPDTDVICVHPEPGVIDRRLAPTLGVVADVEEFLHAFGPAYRERAVSVAGSWIDRARLVNRANGPLGDVSGAEATLDAQLVTRMIDAAPDSWIVTMDPGFGPLTLSASADFGGSPFIYAHGLGAMGFAVPNAIGATMTGGIDGALAVIGDGSFFMSLSSLESIASLDVPVVVLVLDDGGFGSQRKKQQEGYGRNVGVDYDNPDIPQIASAMRIDATWVESVADIDRLCADLPARTRGQVLAVRRAQVQHGTWYEGGTRR
ncbi:thiamine pyrophosphate-binding protein [Phytoactinopolyspora halophila]|nr:thiamine pyrophosphate-binding protein [Phytoactinopolyspora halophila]